MAQFWCGPLIPAAVADVHGPNPVKTANEIDTLYLWKSKIIDAPAGAHTRAV